MNISISYNEETDRVMYFNLLLLIFPTLEMYECFTHQILS